MRNFCVLTLDAKYHPNKGTWSSEYTNHRVLVGAKDKVDPCKAAIEDKMNTGWNFKVNE